MTAEEPNNASQNNPLARALSRWDWEGGGLDPDPEKRATLMQEEEQILHCLGAAVVTCWNDLPTQVQRELFRRAVSVSEPLPAKELKEHIARFLHSHKDL